MPSATIPVPRQSRSRLLGTSGGELTFVVLTGEHQGRQVRIRTPKCTIGSAPGCTLRLRARGVHPLHCWILRGAGGTIVRRRHRDTRLNGQAFEDAPLSPGDRLRIGSVEIEVLECPPLAAEWTEATAVPLPAYDEIDRQLWERTAQLSAEAQDQLRAEMQDLERQTAMQLAELHEQVARVSLERDALLGHKQQLESSLATGQQELGELRTQIAARQAEIEAVLHAEARGVAVIQSRLEEVLRERAALEARAQSAAAHNDSPASEQESERLSEERQRLSDQLAQLRELVGYTSAERDRLTLHLDDAQRQMLAHEQQLQEEKRELQTRLEQTALQLAESERQLAVLRTSVENQLQAEAQRAAQLQERLDRAQVERTDLESQLRQESTVWNSERARLFEQHERQGEQRRQLEGQLAHVRELVESLASERESLCQQLEAAELRHTAGERDLEAQRAAIDVQNRQQWEDQLRQQFQEQWAQRLAAGQQQVNHLEQQLAQLEREAALREETLATTGRRLANLDELLAERDRQLAERDRQLQESSDLIAQRDGQIAALGSQIAAHEEELAARAQQLDEARRQLADQRTQGQAAEEQLAAAESRTRSLERQHATELATRSEESVRWQQQAEDAAAQAAALQGQLADAQTRLADAQTQLAAHEAQVQARLHSEHEHRLRWEERAGQLQYQLTAAELKVVAAENRLDELRTKLHAEQADAASRLAALEAEWQQRLGAEQQRAQGRDSQTSELEAARAALARQLDELNEAVRFERDTWHHDRERLHQECRMLGHRLIQKQKELDELHEKVRAAATPASPSPAGQAAAGQGTITMDEIHRQMETAAALEEQRAAWNAERDRLRQEIDRLQAELAAQPEFAQQMTLSQQQLAELPTSAEAASQAEAQQELAQERQRLASENELLEAIRHETESQQAELKTSQAEFETRWRQWEETLRGKEQSLARREEELAARLVQVAAGSEQAAALEHDRQEQERRESTLALAETRLADREAELDKRQQLLEEALARCERMAAESAAAAEASPALTALAPLGGAPAPSSAAKAPMPVELSTAAASDSAEVDSMLSRLVETGVWHGDEGSGKAPAPPSSGEHAAENGPSVPEHCAAQFADVSLSDAPKPVWHQPDAEAPPADDESIEAYMSRLLQRVRGDAPGGIPASAPAPIPAPRPAPAPPPPPPKRERPAPAIVAVQVEPPKPEPYLPRQKAPEHTTNLQAMRELANSAASIAIVKHQKQSGHHRALLKLIGASMTFTCALGAAYLAYRTDSLLATGGAAIGLVAALYWGGKGANVAFRTMLLKPQLLRDKTAVRRGKAPEPDRPVEQPVVSDAPDASIGGDSLPLDLIPTDPPPPESGETLSPD